MRFEYLGIALKSIMERRMRSWLTMIGIFIGIAAVVALISLGQGLQKSISDAFAALGTDKLLIQPKGQIAGPGTQTSTIQFDQSDLDVVKHTRGVEEAIGWNVRMAEIRFNDQTRFFYIGGIPTEDNAENKLYTEISDHKIEEGRDLKSGDTLKIAVGYSLAHDKKFDRNIRVGDRVLINKKEFEVIGIYESLGSPPDDTAIFMSRQILQRSLELGDTIDTIAAKVSAGEDISIVEEAVKKKLRNHRKVEENKEDFSIQTPEQFLQAFMTVLSIVQTVLVGLAAISLVVGGVGIMNTMYTAVLERTKEIGIMKSVGARNYDIAVLFLIESGLLGMFGGIIGVLIGMGLSKLVVMAAKAAGYGIIQAFFPLWSIIGVLFFAFIVGALAGALPALQASKLQPVDALRYE
ncbi:MAG TPA: ABC transporter permease [Candidatus Nanoarchaeia archaeon]|nr:ABC transporter permease [Candidatus Nanoarchaeia archaeon]